VSAHARRHLTVIVGLFLLMLAWHFRLEMYQLLMNRAAPSRSFGYIDHRVGIPGALLLSLATLACAGARATQQPAPALTPEEKTASEPRLYRACVAQPQHF